MLKLTSALFAVAVLSAQPFHVFPHGWYGDLPITPGNFAAIYGSNLIPSEWCEQPRTQLPPYPTEVCGVRILVDDLAAPLLYVGNNGSGLNSINQINFQVPPLPASAKNTAIRVCVRRSCTAPVSVAVTTFDILIRQSETAYVGGPIWLEFRIPTKPGDADLSTSCRIDLDTYSLEIRRNGRVLSKTALPECIPRPLETSFRIGPKPRVPLHLAYPFETGVYEVRVSGPVFSPDFTHVVRTGYSDWLAIEVHPTPP
jgi:hypothetical protein